MSELGIPAWSPGAKKPGKFCKHLTLTFGCRNCISFARESQFYEAIKQTKAPACGDCGRAMTPYEWNLDSEGRIILHYGCEKEDGGGNMYCDEDKGFSTVIVER